MQVLRSSCKAFTAILIAACLVPGLAVAQNASGDKSASAPVQLTPPWAYPLDPPGVEFTPMLKALKTPPAPDRDTPIHIPGTEVALTLNQVSKGADWHPNDHPPMPDIVANGRRPAVLACSFCHLQNGEGRVESSRLAGLSAAYMIQQINDFRNDLRKCAEPRSVPGTLMAPIAKKITDDEMKIAVEYYAGLTFKPFVKVVEAATVPKTILAGGILMPIQTDPQPMEPIGNRIIEVPESVERVALHDSEAGFVAYVPPGSIKKGEFLVTTGGAKVVGGKIVPGRTVQCGICHGSDLKGLGNVPAIAGDGTSYLTRQLYDFQHGTRHGQNADLMKAAVSNLTEEDLIDIVAYVASRNP